jgi:hypothetical protein
LARRGDARRRAEVAAGRALHGVHVERFGVVEEVVDFEVELQPVAAAEGEVVAKHDRGRGVAVDVDRVQRPDGGIVDRGGGAAGLTTVSPPR